MCGGPYRMQAVGDPERLATNPKPKWEVPIEVIEWQPSYVQKGVCPVLASPELPPGEVARLCRFSLVD